jgi:hypothetical protein
MVCTGWIRVTCMVCRSEAVVWTSGEPIVGTSSFQDLATATIGCFMCDGDDFETSRHPASVGFLCVTNRKNDKDFVCTLRKKSNRVRQRLLSGVGLSDRLIACDMSSAALLCFWRRLSGFRVLVVAVGYEVCLR